MYVDNNELNLKQKNFCLEYLKDLNGKQAAIRSGYSEKTAVTQASRLLMNEKVQKYLRKLMDEKNDKLIAEQDEVLRTLTRVLRREESETVVVTLKSHKTHFDKKGKKVVKDEEAPQRISIPTKICDVNKAAELLGKRYGLFVDKLEGNIVTENQKDIQEFLEGAKNGKFIESQTKKN